MLVDSVPSTMAHNQQFVPYQALHSFVGMATYVCLHCPGVVASALLYACLGNYECHYNRLQGFSPKWGLLGHQMRLNKRAKRELEWWGRLFVMDSSIMLVVPMAVTLLCTDAKLWHWRVVLDE